MTDTPVTTNCSTWLHNINQQRQTSLSSSMLVAPLIFAAFSKALERETLNKLDKLEVQIKILAAKRHAQ